MSRMAGRIIDKISTADFAHRIGFCRGQLCALDWTHIDYVQNLVTLQVPGNSKSVTLSMSDAETLEPGFILLRGPRNENHSIRHDNEVPDLCQDAECQYARSCPKITGGAFAGNKIS